MDLCQSQLPCWTPYHGDLDWSNCKMNFPFHSFHSFYEHLFSLSRDGQVFSLYWYSFGLLLVTWSKSLALRDLKSLARWKKAKKYEKSWSLDFISSDYFVMFSTFVLLLQNRWMTVAAFWRRRSKLREMKSSSSSSANRYWSSRSFSKNSTWTKVR